MRKHLGTLLVVFTVLTAFPAQAHAGWFTCENGDWQWSWQFWNWGCECDSGWETTPSPWIDQCTTHIHESCADGGRYDYICFWPGGNISSDMQCAEDDVNLESRCEYYDQWETPFTVFGPGDGWYYKTCPRTHICVDQKFDFNDLSKPNPCAELEFNTGSPADRPCGFGNITTY